MAQASRESVCTAGVCAVGTMHLKLQGPPMQQGHGVNEPCRHATSEHARLHTGEVEYPEFIEIMTTTLSRMEQQRAEAGGDSGAPPVPFALLATAYR